MSISNISNGSKYPLKLSETIERENTTKLDEINERLMFIEKVMDLFIFDMVDKHRYIQLRKLFFTNEKEFAIKIVNELHKEII